MLTKINLLTKHQPTCTNPGRRRFIYTAAAIVAAGLGLTGCRKTAKPAPQTENPTIQRLLRDIAPTNNEFVIESSLKQLSKIPGGAKHLLGFIEQGTFMQFYYSAKALISSSLIESGATIAQMLSDANPPWEKALGLILLGEKSEQKPNNTVTAKLIIAPYLLADNSLLQLGAIIGLIRMKRADVLLPFIQHYQDTEAGKKANCLIKDANLSPLLERSTTDWWPTTTFQTCFFRYPNILDELQADYSGRARSEYVVWDIGCSTGLTTESMRIALSHNNGKARFIGTDLSPLAVLYAARGIYPLESLTLLISEKANELENFYNYARLRGWNPEEVLGRFFEKTGDIYVSRRNPAGLAFEWDDITAPYSPIQDRSIDIAVYTNVHYQLSYGEQKLAVQKLFKKLKPGGKVLFMESSRTPSGNMSDFIPLFGSPVKTTEDYLVFQKP